MSSGTVIVIAGILVATACALLGTFLVLRRMSMMADAISHAILPGLVAGFFSKMNSFEAACTAVYFNGLAGIMAYQKSGLHMVATDLLDNLPQVMKKFDQIENN